MVLYKNSEDLSVFICFHVGGVVTSTRNIHLQECFYGHILTHLILRMTQQSFAFALFVSAWG